MRFVVFGANGKLGSKVVKELLAQGESVTAFIHSKNNLPKNTKLKIIKGDIKNSQEVKKALRNADVIISALGSWGTKSKDIQVAGMNNIIPNAEKLNIKRIISITGAGAITDGQKPSIIIRLAHFGFSIFNKKILDDGEKHIKLLRKSSLDWTVIRSPIMNELGSRKYRLRKKEIMPWKTIHREAVVSAMIDLARKIDFNKQTPFIYR